MKNALHTGRQSKRDLILWDPFFSFHKERIQRISKWKQDSANWTLATKGDIWLIKLDHKQTNYEWWHFLLLIVVIYFMDGSVDWSGELPPTLPYLGAGSEFPISRIPELIVIKDWHAKTEQLGKHWAASFPTCSVSIEETLKNLKLAHFSIERLADLSAYSQQI